jgi:hypothetical protein
MSGNLEMAKWLYSLGRVNITKNDYVFRFSCKHGDLEIAKWLYSLGGVDIHAGDDYAFRRACENGHLGTAEWLYSLGGVKVPPELSAVFCGSAK